MVCSTDLHILDIKIISFLSGCVRFQYSNGAHDNVIVDTIKLTLLTYNNFSITKIVVKKIERVK